MLSQPQEDIINSVLNGDKPIVCVQALAGAGKTIVMEEIIKRNSSSKNSLRILYLAYNTLVRDFARMNWKYSHFTAHTSHSLALSMMPPGARENYQGRLGTISKEDVAKELDIHVYSGGLVLAILEKYIASDSKRLKGKHVSIPKDRVPESKIKVARKNLKFLVRDLWREVTKPTGTLSISHDTYLKVWSKKSRNMSMGFDLILWDEVQDSNAALTERIMRESPSTRILACGDIHQTLFNHRINPGPGSKEDFNFYHDHPATHRLLKSFRFGPEIASVGTKILLRMGEPQTLFGNKAVPSVVGRVNRNKPYHVLSLTNGWLIDEILKLDQNVKVHTTSQKLVQTMIEVMELYLGIVSDDVELHQKHGDFETLKRAAMEDEAEELKTFCSYFNRHRSRKLLRKSLNDLKWIEEHQLVGEQDSASVVMSTTHMLKGQTVSQVLLSDEWGVKLSGVFFKAKHPSASQMKDLRVLYVAATRPKNVLEIPKNLLEYLT